MEGPWNEGQEAFGIVAILDAFILRITYAVQMQRAFFHRLAEANDHGSRGIHADLVGRLHDIHPFCP
ncbi:hypothetical protein D3C81_1922610 [compost metagenome]